MKRTLRSIQLVKEYRSRRVVDEVSLEVESGEIVGLLGPNGAGKTTTFRMMVGLTRPGSGRVLLDQIDITRWQMPRRTRQGVGYLSQEPSIFRGLTVRQNILAVLETLSLPDYERQRRLADLLERFELEQLGQQSAASLSGGEKRRLEIARCLAIEPQFLLLDEPFSGVDPIAVSDIQQLVRGLRDEGIGILITDHSVRETLEVTDRSYIMHNGRILTHGPSGELVRDPQVIASYLGENFYMRESAPARPASLS